MFDFFRGKSQKPKEKETEEAISQEPVEPETPSSEESASQEMAAQEPSAPEPVVPESASPEPTGAESSVSLESVAPKKGWFSRLKSRLTGGDKSAPVAVEPDQEEAGKLAVAAVPEVAPEAVPETVPAETISTETSSTETSSIETSPEECQAALRPPVEAEEAALVEPGPFQSAADEPAISVSEPLSPESPTPVEPASESTLEPVPEAAQDEAPAEEAKPKKGWFARLKDKLASTRAKISGRLEAVLSSTREIDEETLEELEEILISSDLGVKTTDDLLVQIRGQVKRKELKDSGALKAALRARLLEIIELPARPALEVKPLVIMMVGINGVGKTTTIAKLSRRFKEEGRSVLLAAGDTFRAAAVEQLTIWAKRVGADIVSQPTGADASAVVFDALSAAKARGIDVVIIDTAGRLHTKVNLMEELKKIKRVANKALPGAPHETVLILDANTGQNAASQARTFHDSIKVDSLIVTKLDGTSKGGVVVSIINELKLPVTYIGIGETYDDLRPFAAADFVEAIMGPQGQ
ncbi:MAG: signal recognition particle-docking protein FtsY [Deltaproteobacteria bacterium]|jgi:fused signal recognition particle receptor|nr:signal recognition particle-docking protein FtsY [Deltaproteobacteria bacterium]